MLNSALKNSCEKTQVLLTDSNNNVPTLSLGVTQTDASETTLVDPQPPHRWTSWALCGQERGRVACNLPLQGQGDPQ